MYGTKSINELKRNPDYWIELCDDLIKECKKRIKEKIIFKIKKSTGKDPLIIPAVIEL